MKIGASVILLFVFAATIGGCSHQRQNKSVHFDLTEQQLEQINREAIISSVKKMEETVIAAKTNPNTARYLATDLFLKGNMSLLEGDYATASLFFKNLIVLVPEDEFVQKKYAISLIRLGDLESSLDVLKKLYNVSNDEKVGLILAGVYSGLDKELLAQKIYKKILTKNPRNEDACIFLSKSITVAGNSDKAIKQLKSCSEADKKNGMFDYYIGKIYLDLGKTNLAMNSFRSAFGRQGDLGQAVSALGILLEEKDQHDSAIKIYVKYLKKNLNDGSILNRIVQTLFIKERYAEVIPYAEALSDLEPDNLNLKVKLGILYTDTKEYSKAISVFKDLLSAAPQSDKILYYLGVIHQEINEYQVSIEYFNQIPSSSGLYTDSSVQMATMLSILAQANFSLKDEDAKWSSKFLSFINSKLEEFKDMRVEFSVIKSGYFEGIGNFREAMETMALVQHEKNFSTQHKYYLANLFEKEKKFEDSTSLIMGILEKEPKNAHAWNFLGYSMLVRGNEMDKAYEYIQRAYNISPEDGYIRDSLGWYYYKKGETVKALKELEFAFKKIPDDIEILKHLAIVHKELKDYSRARSFFEFALKNVRLQYEKQEILSAMEELDSKRIPASDN